MFYLDVVSVKVSSPGYSALYVGWGKRDLLCFLLQLVCPLELMERMQLHPSRSYPHQLEVHRPVPPILKVRAQNGIYSSQSSIDNRWTYPKHGKSHWNITSTCEILLKIVFSNVTFTSLLINQYTFSKTAHRMIINISFAFYLEYYSKQKLKRPLFDYNIYTFKRKNIFYTCSNGSCRYFLIPATIHDGRHFLNNPSVTQKKK